LSAACRIQAKTEFRIGSVISNCTGRSVLLHDDRACGDPIAVGNIAEM